MTVEAPVSPRRRWLVGLVTFLLILTSGLVLVLRQPPQQEGAPPSEPGRTPEQSPRPDAETHSPSSFDPLLDRHAVGLHYTSEELKVWRARAEEGPYRHAGDVSPGSPGDWDRIEQQAQDFLEDPAGGRWEGPEDFRSSGCVRSDSSNDPPREGPSRLRDAAFYYLVTGDTRHRDGVREELLAQAREPGVDFSQRDEWCTDEIADVSPSFGIANWLTKLIYAYDYLGQDSFTSGERRLLNRFFYDAAAFWQEDLNSYLDRLFVDRWAGDYTLTELGSDVDLDSVETGYYGSKPIYSLHRHYNNRRATVARYVGVTAIKLSMEDYTSDTGVSLDHLRRTSVLFAQEWIRFSVFPEGFFGEFERWTSDNPSLGWAYGATVLTSVATIADTFARHGDRSIVDYETAAGALGTESRGARTLLFAAHSIGRYVDGTYKRYATDERPLEEDDLIDTIHDDWVGLHDIQVAPVNLYYRDPYLRELVLRRGSGMPGYPEVPASSGQHEVWAGDWGTYPATLMMFAGVEEEVWPYGDQPARS